MKKPLIGGILSIIAGVLALLIGFRTAYLAIVFPSLMKSHFPDRTIDPNLLHFVTFIYSIWSICSLVAGILSIVGGTFAVRRKKWGLALTGAIASCFAVLPLGIGALVLIAMARPVFDANKTEA